MNKKIIQGWVVAISLLFSLLASAMEISTYEELKRTSPEILKVHINGVGTGYAWSNSLLRSAGAKPLYCPPESITLNAENYMDIVDNKIANLKIRKQMDVPVEMALFLGLAESFSCL